MVDLCCKGERERVSECAVEGAVGRERRRTHAVEPVADLCDECARCELVRVEVCAVCGDSQVECGRGRVEERVER